MKGFLLDGVTEFDPGNLGEVRGGLLRTEFTQVGRDPKGAANWEVGAEGRSTVYFTIGYTTSI